MSAEDNMRLAQQFLARLAQGAEPDTVASQFASDLQFEIADDAGAVPWIGRRTGRQVVADFIRDTRRIIERLRFEVEDVMASGQQPRTDEYGT